MDFRRIVIATFYHMQALLGKTGTTVTLNCNLTILKLPRFDVKGVDEVEFTPKITKPLFRVSQSILYYGLSEKRNSGM